MIRSHKFSADYGRFLKSKSGTTAVEFALILLPLMLLLFGVFEFSRMVNIKNNMIFSANAAERVLSMNHRGRHAHELCLEAEAIMRRSFIGGDPGRLNVFVDELDGYLMLTAKYDTNLLVPVLNFGGPSFEIRRRIQMSS